jgi:hypothetical protein
MAYYMLSVKIFSRGKGGCATRAAAYRAGERIRDERTRSTHNFEYREDVVHKEILLPSQFSSSPEMDWARDRATLWNQVESTDRRNARVAREILVVLPPELTPTQRVQLVRGFARELSDRYLGAVDATVHLPRPGPTDRDHHSHDANHHAHLLLTPRQITPEGFGPRTILELYGRDLHALGLGPSNSELLLIRERWAQMTNEKLHEAGLEMRVDHRSLKARGIDREPAPRIPHEILCMERRTGMPSKVGEAIRASYRERVEARLRGPDELALVLEKQKEMARQKAAERARQTPELSKGICSATYTAEERLEMRRELYQPDEALREKRRAYRQKNAELIKQKAREARARNALSPQQKSVQRWLKWRQKQEELAREQTPASKQVELTHNAGPQRAKEHALEKSAAHDHDDVFDRRREKSLDYDYGL